MELTKNLFCLVHLSKSSTDMERYVCLFVFKNFEIENYRNFFMKKMEQTVFLDTLVRWYLRLKWSYSDFMSGSCHLYRESNVQIGVECQIFVIVIFFNCSRVLQFGAHSRYYKGALTQKRSFLVICTTTFRSAFLVDWKNQINRSTLNSPLDGLSKWHEPDIRLIFVIVNF